MSGVGKDYEFVASLPPSTQPWKIHTFQRSIVLVNPEHAARIVKPDGTIYVLEAADMPGEDVKIQSACVPNGYVARCASKLFQTSRGKS